MHRSLRRRIGVSALFTFGVLYAGAPVFAHDGEGLKVTPLMQKSFPDMPGKDGLVLTVEFAPGFVDQPHRHDAHVFVYMLEGSIETRVNSGPLVTLNPGDVFYETPGDIHSETRNVSATKPAKFLVFFVKDHNTPPVLPANKH
ncbi:MAG: cupin domain-containing protein [Burkholderiales bacterium]|nr:cupin domain-containing protein [Burkholderiales bacterium]